jgi:alpha-galactosidase/6-phospho-beta-glucosidase family protein
MSKPRIEKITVIGGGSTYTPELIGGFIKNENNLDVGEIALYDIDEQRLNVVGGMAQRMVMHAEMDTKVTLNTTNRPKAVEGAKFVLSSMRIGKMPARVLDEKIPLKYNVIGQETPALAELSKPSALFRSLWPSPKTWKSMPRCLVHQLYQSFRNHDRSDPQTHQSACGRPVQ